MARRNLRMKKDMENILISNQIGLQRDEDRGQYDKSY